MNVTLEADRTSGSVRILTVFSTVGQERVAMLGVREIVVELEAARRVAIIVEGRDSVMQLGVIAFVDSAEQVPVFIQPVQPVTQFPRYLWIQTMFSSPEGFAVWFEDGTP